MDVDCAAHQVHATVGSNNSRNVDHMHQAYDRIRVRERTVLNECVCMYKPVGRLALLFPSGVSGIEKTKGEKSVLQLIQRAPHHTDTS